MLNRAEIIGRITHAPELGYTNSGIAFCNLRIATNRVVSRATQTEFHTVVAWNALAEQIAQGLAKGEVAYVEGRLEENTWLEARSAAQPYADRRQSNCLSRCGASCQSDGASGRGRTGGARGRAGGAR